MKSKKGMVTISLVLWLSFILVLVGSLYSLLANGKVILDKNNKVKIYNDYEKYYDVIKNFEDSINEKILVGEIKDWNEIRRESYFLESDFREYKVSYDYLKARFLLEVIEKDTGDIFKSYYQYIENRDKKIIFERVI